MAQMPFILGIAAGVLCTASLVPQAVRVWRTKDTKSLSLSTFIVFSIGVSVWLIYGIVIEQAPIIIANACTLVLAIVILTAKIKFG